MKGLCNMPALTQLLLMENSIKNFANLEEVPGLKVINLQKNLIEGFGEPGQLQNLPALPILNELNIAENKISDKKFIANLIAYKASHKIFTMNPQALEEGGETAKKDILKILLHLKRINDEEVV